MEQQPLQPYNDMSKDLFFWIKLFFIDKLSSKNLNKGYSDNLEKVKSENLIFFDRERYKVKLYKTKNLKELRKLILEISKNGLKAPNNFRLGVEKFFKYISNLKQLNSIRDINIDIIKTYFNSEFVKHKASTSTINTYGAHKNSLFNYIDNFSISNDNFKFNMLLNDLIREVKDSNNLDLNTKKSLEEKEFSNFIGAIDSYKGKLKSRIQRDFILKFLCFSGLSSENIISLEINKVSKVIDNKKEYLQIKYGENKTKKIDYNLIKKEYEGDKEFRKENKINCKYLFYSRYFKEYAEGKSLQRFVENNAKQAKITRIKISPNIIKNSYQKYFKSKNEDESKMFVEFLDSSRAKLKVNKNVIKNLKSSPSKPNKFKILDNEDLQEEYQNKLISGQKAEEIVYNDLKKTYMSNKKEISTYTKNIIFELKTQYDFTMLEYLRSKPLKEISMFSRYVHTKAPFDIIYTDGINVKYVEVKSCSSEPYKVFMSVNELYFAYENIENYELKVVINNIVYDIENFPIEQLYRELTTINSESLFKISDFEIYLEK